MTVEELTPECIRKANYGEIVEFMGEDTPNHRAVAVAIHWMAKEVLELRESLRIEKAVNERLIDGIRPRMGNLLQRWGSQP